MEAVKVQPSGRHVVSTGHNYSMPLSYAGWFEVMSEDGKAVEPVTTVADLAALWPAECVVREALRAIVCPGAGAAEPGGGTTRLDQTRAVAAGECLVLRDVVDATVETRADQDDATTDDTAPPPPTKHYLRCVDAVGDSVFLDMNQVLKPRPRRMNTRNQLIGRVRASDRLFVSTVAFEPTYDLNLLQVYSSRQ